MLRKLCLLATTCALPLQLHAATIANLNMSNFTVDKAQDFTTSKSFDTSLWSNVFGSSFWLSDTSPDGLWISSSSSNGWAQSGIMQVPNACSSGFGYGLFHWRARAGQLTQGPGVNLVMWRADDQWLSASVGTDVDTEIDAMESWDSKGTAFSTEHSYDAAYSGNNHQVFHSLTFPTGNITTMHDYDIDWEAGSLTMYIDDVPQWQTLGSAVPKDNAHGGCNETLGAQVFPNGSTEGLPTVQLMIANSGHYTYTGGATATAAVSITGATLGSLSGTFVLKGTLAGATQTLAWTGDGFYEGVVSTNQASGSWSALLDIPTGTAHGTHTITVYEVANPSVNASYTVTY